ncbi:MAG: hypothetical protein FJ303_16630 [Planctomycetes bacterium]|nr:hypothetical protein [Planctomycetota bacterium]
MNMRRQLFAASVVLIPFFLTGCSPLSMGFATPIPMQAWVADRTQERMENKNDHRVPILPAIPPGYRPYCEDPPDQQEILRALPRVARGIPYIYEEFRDDIEFTVEKLVDKIDPPRFIPLIGPAQLHHCHYKCTVYYTETIDSSYPFPFRTKRRTAQVVYIDKDHYHLCVSGPDAQQSVNQELMKIRTGY